MATAPAAAATPETPAAATPGGAAAGPADAKLQSALAQLDRIAEKDKKLTGPDQIERLTKPAAKYLNINPFEVLQVDPDITEDELKKRKRKLSFLCHPDKNRGIEDKAREAFDVINEAFKTITEDKEQMEYVAAVLEEAQQLAKRELAQKRAAAKKKNGENARIEEDLNSDLRAEYVRVTSVKLFAGYARRKANLEEIAEREKRKFEEDSEKAKEKSQERKKKQKVWEDGREKRIGNWRDFANKTTEKKKKKKKKPFGFMKVPKLKQEARRDNQ